MASSLGIKTHTLQFEFAGDASFHRYQYRFDDEKGMFELWRSFGSLTGELEWRLANGQVVKLPGVNYHNVESQPGDSGSPLISGINERLVGFHSGLAWNFELSEHRPVAVNARQVIGIMIDKFLIKKKNGGPDTAMTLDEFKELQDLPEQSSSQTPLFL